MTNNAICFVCGGTLVLYQAGTTDGATYFSGASSYDIAGGDYAKRLPISQCVVCGHGVTSWEVSPAVITAWYARHHLDTVFLADEAGRRKTARGVLRRLHAMFPKLGRLFDVGAGPGLFLSEAARAGWQVDGLEPAAASRDFAREHWGITVREGSSEDLSELAAGTFDVVTAFDVLEHVTDPVTTLRDMARVLRPGGCVVLTTPKFDSALARLMGRRWYALFPAHLHYFTSSSLTRCLALAGFTDIVVRAHTRHLSVGYVGRRLRGWIGQDSADEASRRGVLARLNVPVVLGDEFEVYARIAR